MCVSQQQESHLVHLWISRWHMKKIWMFVVLILQSTFLCWVGDELKWPRWSQLVPNFYADGTCLQLCLNGCALVQKVKGIHLGASPRGRKCTSHFFILLYGKFHEATSTLLPTLLPFFLVLIPITLPTPLLLPKRSSLWNAVVTFVLPTLMSICSLWLGPSQAPKYVLVPWFPGLHIHLTFLLTYW